MSRFILSHSEARRRAIDCVSNAPEGYVVTVKEKTRSLDQNSLFHAMLTFVSNNVIYGGELRPLEYWKAIIVDEWERQTNRKPNIALGLSGYLVNWRCSTADLSKSDMTSLIEFAKFIIMDKFEVDVDALERKGVTYEKN